jgi:hypothetical protein
MSGTCSFCGERATAACDAPDCHNTMCDAHMHAHVVTSFDPHAAEHPDPPVQWFCDKHKALADQ